MSPLPIDLARITELRVFEYGGFRAIVDGVGGWGSTQLAAIENATENAKKLNAPQLTSTVREGCPVCMGSGYSNHPDSGEVCHLCKGQGEVTRAVRHEP